MFKEIIRQKLKENISFTESRNQSKISTKDVLSHHGYNHVNSIHYPSLVGPVPNKTADIHVYKLKGSKADIELHHHVNENSVILKSLTDGNKKFKSLKSLDKTLSLFGDEKPPLLNQKMNESSSLKLVKTYNSNDGRIAKVYKDAEWEEHRVKFFKDGKHLKNADYHTDDKDDAHKTAQYFLRTTNEEQLDEGAHPNRSVHKKLLSQGWKVSHYPSETTDYGNGETGPMVSHSPAHYKYTKKNNLTYHIIDSEGNHYIEKDPKLPRGWRSTSKPISKAEKEYYKNSKTNKDLNEEQLDEISKDTLEKYKDKALDDFSASHFAAKNTSGMEKQHWFARQNKRRKGISKAITRLDRIARARNNIKDTID